MEELELSLRNPFDVLKIYALQCVQHDMYFRNMKLVLQISIQ